MSEKPAMAQRFGRPAGALVAHLHYLELGCADPVRSAAFYERALQYHPVVLDDARLLQGPGRRLVLVEGTPKSLVSAGYALPDRDELAALRSRIAKAGVPAKDGSTRLFEDSVTIQDPDGNTFSFGLPWAVPQTPTSVDGPQARLQHVVIASRHPAAIVSFFLDVLGFTLSDDVLDEEGGIRTQFLRSSNEHHSFAVFRAAENRLDHHCYETSDWNDIRDWADHLADQHVALEWGPGRHGPGNNLFIFVHDPDGNWIELSAELEIVAHDREVGKWPHSHRTLNSWGLGRLRS